MVSRGSSIPLDVCVASINFYPTYAGPAVRFKRYAPGFRNRNIRMRVFSGTHETKKAKTSGESSFSNNHSEARIGSLLPMVSVDGLPIQMVKLSGNNRLRRLITYNRQLLTYCSSPMNRPALLQLLSLSVFTTYALWRLRRLGVPLVHTHTLLKELSSNSSRRALQKLNRRMPLQLLDCIVVSSSVMELELRNLGLSTRIEVIPNGVDLARFKPIHSQSERRALRHHLGIDQDATVLTTVGPVSPRKGTDLIIEAWGRICQDYPDSRLIIVGPRYDKSYPSYREFGVRIRTLVSNTGAADKIMFTGPTDRVEDYMRASDGFIFASSREGMPNVIPEAMGCGLPIILTPFFGLPEEFGRPGEHYILTERTVEGLAMAIHNMLQSPEQHFSLGLHGRRWAEETMDVEISLDRYANLYQEIADRRSMGPSTQSKADNETRLGGVRAL